MATAETAAPAAPEAGHAGEARVTPLELFFDLVFVFAMTQVTGLLVDEPTWSGLVRGILVLTVIWWAWVGFSWLTNSVNPEEGVVRVAVFGAMAGMLVVSLATPQAFGDDALLFACAYVAVRALHVALYHLATRERPEMHAAVLRIAPGLLLGPALLIPAAFLDGVAQGAVWVLAIAVDLLAPVVAGTEGWDVSPGHFAERHGLIVIIALGESIVAVGAGAAGLPIDAGLVVAGVLGLAVAAALWWTYFDVVAIAAERRLREATGAARAALARDSYSFLHLPMIAGIVLFAFGVKKILGHVGDPLDAVPALGLGGGVALYLLAHVAFRLRNVRTLARRRVVAAAACVAVIPLATVGPGLVALALVAGITSVLIAYEAIRFRDARRRLRLAHG